MKKQVDVSDLVFCGEVNMATPIIMPRQGQSVESCIISKWYKKKGDKVNIGDILFSYETDKAAFDEEAKVEGTLLDIFFEEGDDVPVLTNVCVIGNPGESTNEFRPDNSTSQAQEASASEEASKDKTVERSNQAEVCEANTLDSKLHSEANISIDNGKLKISPRARNLAEKLGVDSRYAAATGPNGRIIERDIISLSEKGPIVTNAARSQYLNMEDVSNIAGTGIGGRITTSDLSAPVAVPSDTKAEVAAPKADFEEVKLTNIRKVIAKAMYNSLSTTAQLTLNTSFDATEILEYRKKLKEGKDKLGLANITINDIILFAVSRTIIKYRELNAHFLDDKMVLFNNVHLGVAVDTERGLMVPVIFNANQKSLNEISEETKKLIDSCQKGTISPDLLKGGTFTVTNLGTLGIESFTPVLNAPQTGILGVNTIVQRVKEVDGEYKYYPAMGLSLTFDHRALDGAPAARFLQDLKNNLENFTALLAK